MFRKMLRIAWEAVDTRLHPKGLILEQLIFYNVALLVAPYFPGSKWPLLIAITLSHFIGWYDIYLQWREKHGK